MKELRFGLKAGIGPVLKIMKSDTDNPFTTPNTDFGKFIFNSEIQKVGYIDNIFEWAPDFSTFPSSGGTTTSPKRYFYPVGSNWSTASAYIESYVESGHSIQNWYFFENFFGLPFFPLVEVRTPIAPDYDTFTGPNVDTTAGQVSSIGTTKSFAGFQSLAYHIPVWDGSSWHKDKGPAIRLSFNTAGIQKYLLTVYDLPMFEDAIPSYAGTLASGQEPIRIDKASGGIARIALPGRTVADADPRHYILHENRIPAKIMKAGEITVNSGATGTIVCPLPLTKYTYMDFMAKKTSETYFFHPPYIQNMSESQSLTFTYEVSGSTITINNTSGYNIVIRYAVFADSEQATTTGGKNILWKGNDGSQDFIQIKRPGSHDTAYNLNDIMIDTRLTYFPILAEGFLNYPDDFPLTPEGTYYGDRKATITYANPAGFKPFPKLGVIFGGTPSVESSSFEWQYAPKAFWCDHAVFINSGSLSGYARGGSSWSKSRDADNAIDVYMCNRTMLRNISGGNYVDHGPLSPVIGMRYYIFGIPTS